MALITYPTTFRWDTSEDIVQATNNPELKPEVEKLAKGCFQIDVAKTMNDLVQIGNLLKIANAGSKGSSSSVKTIEIALDYQRLINNAVAACDLFVNACLSALKNHQAALDFVKDNPVRAKQKIEKTAQLAGEMAKVCQDLFNQATALSDTAKTGIMAATQDETLNTAKRQELQKMLDEMKAQEAALKQKSEDLTKAVEKEEAKEKEAAQEAKTMRGRAFNLALLSAVVTPAEHLLTTYLNAQSGGLGLLANAIGKTEESPLQSYVDERSKMHKQLEEARIKKAGLAQELANDPGKKNTLEPAIAKLDEEININKEKAQQLQIALDKLKGEFDKEVRRTEERESEIAKELAGHQKELRDSNAELKKTIQRLADLKTEDGTIEKAIVSLQVTLQTLLKVRNVFENTRLFWQLIERQCKKLSNIEEIEDAIEHEKAGRVGRLETAIKISGLTWLGLGRVNLTAFNSMQTVKAHYDNEVMTKLPANATEAMQLVQTYSTNILNDLRDQQQ